MRQTDLSNSIRCHQTLNYAINKYIELIIVFN